MLPQHTNCNIIHAPRILTECMSEWIKCKKWMNQLTMKVFKNEVNWRKIGSIIFTLHTQVSEVPECGCLGLQQWPKSKLGLRIRRLGSPPLLCLMLTIMAIAGPGVKAVPRPASWSISAFSSGGLKVGLWFVKLLFVQISTREASESMRPMGRTQEQMPSLWLLCKKYVCWGLWVL